MRKRLVPSIDCEKETQHVSSLAVKERPSWVQLMDLPIHGDLLMVLVSEDTTGSRMTVVHAWQLRIVVHCGIVLE